MPDYGPEDFAVPHGDFEEMENGVMNWLDESNNETFCEQKIQNLKEAANLLPDDVLLEDSRLYFEKIQQPLTKEEESKVPSFPPMTRSRGLTGHNDANILIDLC